MLINDTALSLDFLGEYPSICVGREEELRGTGLEAKTPQLNKYVMRLANTDVGLLRNPSSLYSALDLVLLTDKTRSRVQL